MRGSGTLYAWITILAIVWIATLLWIIFTQVNVGHIIPWAEEQFDDLNLTDEAVTLDNLQNYWNYWPLLLVVGLTVYGIASSLKREPEGGYSGTWG